MGIFLTPETTFAIDIKEGEKRIGGRTSVVFDVVEGGPFVLRTATGREYARIMQAIVGGSIHEAAYDLLPPFLISGIASDDIGRLDPSVAVVMLQEVARRSRVSESDKGKS